MIETSKQLTPAPGEILDQSTRIFDKIFSAAQPGAVFGEPVTSGPYTIITASEIAAGGGFGFGGGVGPARGAAGKASTDAGAQPQGQEGPTGGTGGGGGGGSSGRPVAVIVVGPDGVTVKPVFDATKLAITAITAWGAAVAILSRMRRAGNKK